MQSFLSSNASCKTKIFKIHHLVSNSRAFDEQSKFQFCVIKSSNPSDYVVASTCQGSTVSGYQLKNYTDKANLEKRKGRGERDTDFV